MSEKKWKRHEHTHTNTSFHTDNKQIQINKNLFISMGRRTVETNKTKNKKTTNKQTHTQTIGELHMLFFRS